MKLYYALLIILVIPLTYGLGIDLSVQKAFTGEIKYFMYNDSSNAFTQEFTNTGSLPYTAQARVDVINSSGIVFTAWSQDRAMMPGSVFPSALYWYPEGGDYTARLRMYYSGEVIEKELNISASAARAENAFDISSARVFNSYVVLGITSSKAMDNIIIIPADYPQGWIFTQAAIKETNSGTSYAIIKYVPSVWEPKDITIYIASKDGKYASKKTVTLEREKGLEALVFNTVFALFA